MTLRHDRPTITDPPEHQPVCCTQKTITVPPSINAKTAQEHDYPSPAHRTSYNRRTAAERTFATLTDRATNDLSRGWCRQMGLTPIALHIDTALITRNIRVADAFIARQAANQRREACRLPPKHRRSRRTTLHDLAATARAPTPPRTRPPTATQHPPPAHADPRCAAHRPPALDSEQKPDPRRRYPAPPRRIRPTQT